MPRELHEPLTDLDLAQALDVDPSPAFAAGVRRRIEETRMAPAWRWRVAAAMAAAIGLVGWFAVGSPPKNRTAVPAASVAERVDAPAVAPVPEEAPTQADARPRATVAPVVRRARAPVRQPREPEVLVSPDQRLALEQLKAALADGRLEPSELPANLVEAPPQPLRAPMDSSDSLGSRTSPNVLPRLEAPRHFVGRVVRTEF